MLQGGVVLLAITLCMQVGYNSASRKLSVDVGGAKKLHALSSLAQATVLFPWATFIYFTKEVCIRLMKTIQLFLSEIGLDLMIKIAEFYKLGHFINELTILYDNVLGFFIFSLRWSLGCI